jgi:hypothetical protein
VVGFDVNDDYENDEENDDEDLKKPVSTFITGPI